MNTYIQNLNVFASVSYVLNLVNEICLGRFWFLGETKGTSVLFDM